MARIDHLLEERLNKGETKEKSTKVKALAARSNKGDLSTFSTLFASSPVTEEEKKELNLFLQEYLQEETDRETQKVESDLEELLRLTTEIRSISHQSIVLHGERIQQAQALLSSYKDGAFSAWLIKIYGNRQTPYNFLLYYELYSALEHTLKRKMELMPKQAVYTLASRNAPLKHKVELIDSYQGETKDELLQEIRKRFPLAKEDKRLKSPLVSILTLVKKLEKECALKVSALTDHEKSTIRKELNRLRQLFQE